MLLLGVLFGLVISGMPTEAAITVANTSQAGSLLMFPLVDTTAGNDTLITIANNGLPNVDVSCQYVTEEFVRSSVQFRIPGYYHFWFRASTGEGPEGLGSWPVPPFENGNGSLICWAVNSGGDKQISHNYLYGLARVYSFSQGTVYEYNSWNFKTNKVASGSPVGTGGTIELNGLSGGYDACPTNLIVDFASLGASVDEGLIKFGHTKIALLPCKQDLRSNSAERSPTCTSMKVLEFRDENGMKYSRTVFQCLKDRFENYLDAIQPANHGKGGDYFSVSSLHTTMGSFRTLGSNNFSCDDAPYLVDPDCKGHQQASPFVGLLTTQSEFNGIKGVTATIPKGLGANGTGYIKWEPSPGHIE